MAWVVCIDSGTILEMDSAKIAYKDTFFFPTNFPCVLPQTLYVKEKNKN